MTTKGELNQISPNQLRRDLVMPQRMPSGLVKESIEQQNRDQSLVSPALFESRNFVVMTPFADNSRVGRLVRRIGELEKQPFCVTILTKPLEREGGITYLMEVALALDQDASPANWDPKSNPRSVGWFLLRSVDSDVIPELSNCLMSWRGRLAQGMLDCLFPVVEAADTLDEELACCLNLPYPPKREPLGQHSLQVLFNESGPNLIIPVNTPEGETTAAEILNLNLAK